MQRFGLVALAASLAIGCGSGDGDTPEGGTGGQAGATGGTGGDGGAGGTGGGTDGGTGGGTGGGGTGGNAGGDAGTGGSAQGGTGGGTGGGGGADECEEAADCFQGTACQSATCSGTPKVCGLDPITECSIASDGCCPAGCTPTNDSDCDPIVVPTGCDSMASCVECLTNGGLDCAKTPREIPFVLKDETFFSKVVYIDPSIATAGDGSSPGAALKSWDNVSWQTDTAYLQKRGTTCVVTKTVTTGAPSVLLGAYGTGAKPHVKNGFPHPGGDSKVFSLNSDDVTIRDLEISSDLSSGINLQSKLGAVVYNNTVHGSGWGIRGYARGFRVLHNEVYDIKDDGMFFQNALFIEVGHNNVHHVNTAWVEPYTPQGTASGDSVQLSDVRNWYVHHNTLDRSDSGNKFAFISNLAATHANNHGLLEHNILKGPKTTGDGGASIYVGNMQNNQLIVRYNTIMAPSPSFLYSHSALEFYGNTITGIAKTSHMCTACDADQILNDNTYN